jgi:predicted RNase H-like nuclease (RuvC/YqgF family)
MGEEQIQQEEQVQEEQVQEEIRLTEESPAVKVLRQKLEQEIKTRKQLEEELTKAKELLNVSDIGSLMSKVEKLELENIVAKKYPELSDEIENIVQLRKAGETIEDTILRYIGKKTVESKPSQTGFSLGSNKLTSNPSEPKGEKLTKEQAEQLFKQLYYSEE